MATDEHHLIADATDSDIYHRHIDFHNAALDSRLQAEFGNDWEKGWLRPKLRASVLRCLPKGTLVCSSLPGPSYERILGPESAEEMWQRPKFARVNGIPCYVVFPWHR